MDIPLQVTFRGLAHSPALSDRIRDKATKLHTQHPRITSCRVTVEARHRHHAQGRSFSARIEIHAPDQDVAVGYGENEDPHVAVREAFDAVHRQLQAHVAIRVTP
jgi:ribosome-associated translation inhibitor RaiA